MSFAAILIALGLEQWRAFDWRGAVERTFVRFVRSLERKFNGGTFQHGAFAAVAAIVVWAPSLVVGLVVQTAATVALTLARRSRANF